MGVKLTYIFSKTDRNIDNLAIKSIEKLLEDIISYIDITIIKRDEQAFC